MVAEDVIVIGGGVVGASAAYALARRGARVTLVDRGDAGQATAAGAGILSPGTSIRPLPAFFAIGQPASAYYDTLLAQLAEDDIRGGTGAAAGAGAAVHGAARSGVRADRECVGDHGG
jgi:glycine/D-amino acid oxidase-like deaminating enzyme